MPSNNLNEKQIHRLIEHLLQGSNEGKLGKNDVNDAATQFECSRYQILRVWKRYKEAEG